MQGNNPAQTPPPAPPHDVIASQTAGTETHAPKSPSSNSGQAKRHIPWLKFFVFGLVGVITIAAFGFIAYLMTENSLENQTKEITSYEECVAAGYPIMESYPEQCAANGQTFTRELSHEEEFNKFLYPVEDWKTRLDTVIGYTIKVPGDVEHNSGRYYFFGDQNKKTKNDEFFGPNLEILEVEGTSAIEIAENELGVDAVLIPVTINNASGVQVDNKDSGFEYFLESEDGKIVRIIYSTQEENPELSRDRINKMTTYAEGMIPTLEFRNENSLLDTDRWKLYQDTKYGYSFLYPDYLDEQCDDSPYEECWFSGYAVGRGPENRIISSVIPVNPEERGSDSLSRNIDNYLQVEVGESFVNKEGDPLEIFGKTRLANVNVDGVQAKIFKEYQDIWEAKQGTTSRIAIIEKDENYYIVSAMLESENISVDQFNLLLKTFKFTN